MLNWGGGGALKVIIIVTETLYFNAFLPVRISVHRRTRLGVATLQSVFSWAEFWFKNWAIVLRLTSNSISASQHIGVMFLLFYTSCSSINKLMTMSGNFCPPVRQ